MDWIGAGVTLLLLFSLGLLVFVLFLVWREGYKRGWRRARSTPPRCLNCGYNLSGLTRCRCPECGAEFCIDELWRKPYIVDAAESARMVRSHSGKSASK